MQTIRSFFLASLAILVTPTLAKANTDDGPSLKDLQRNPWFITAGSFGGNDLLGSALASSETNYSNCGHSQLTAQEVALFQSMGLEFGLGYNIATGPVDLRFSGRVQTFGLTNNQDLGRPHSVLGFDALFRVNKIYFGPGVGMGYAAPRSTGLGFEGVPTGVFSAVVGVDASQNSFAEARLQAAPVRAYQVASVSFGLRF